MKDRKYVANLVLPILGIGLVLYSSVCGKSCAYLKGGIHQTDLTYVGLAFAAVLLIAAFLKRDMVHLLLLVAAVGTEIYLVAFQVHKDVYAHIAFSLEVCS